MIDHLHNKPAKRPRKLSVFNYYLKTHYQKDIKNDYKRRYAALKSEYETRYALATEKQRLNMKQPRSVAVRNQVGTEYWNLETEATCQRIILETQAAHDAAVAEWEATKGGTSNPLRLPPVSILSM